MDEMNNPVESDGVFTYNVGFNFTIENFVLCDGAPITFQNASSCIVKNGVIKYFYYSFGNNSIMGITKNSGILLSGVK